MQLTAANCIELTKTKMSLPKKARVMALMNEADSHVFDKVTLGVCKQSCPCVLVWRLKVSVITYFCYQFRSTTNLT